MSCPLNGTGSEQISYQRSMSKNEVNIVSNILQPCDNDRSTLYAIAWDIVKRELDAGDKRLTSQEIAAEVAKVAARIVIDGGCSKSKVGGAK